ncbi:MAG TPA: AMP-binding protein [Anaeromyxobacter sp.]|nr:AMP-binding protein [Anaeromyxobacter sp.]
MSLSDLTLGALLEQQAAAEPGRDAVVYPDRGLRWTYLEFNERVDRLARGLLAIGVGKGDHVGIWARNVPDWLTFMFATAKIGAVLVTVNTAYKGHELAYVVEQSDMKCLVLIDGFKGVDYLAIVRELVPEAARCERGRLKSARFPRLKSIVYLGPEKHRGMYSVPELLLLGAHRPGEELRAALAATRCDDVINMQYTSGTTGFPKGVMLTHRNILNNGFSIGERQRLAPEDRVCLPVPLFHCFGCVLGVMAAVSHRSTMVMLEAFDPLLTLAAVQKERATAVYGVPTMFIAELAHPMFPMFDLGSLRTGIMAGSPCPIETMRQVMTRMHCGEITIAYGLTEASPVITQTSTEDPAELRATTVGRVLPDVEVRIVDPRTGQECATGEPGELCCRGYNVMAGYYRNPEATAEAVDADGWLHSGDLATVDQAGYYRITGRIKDMIIRGGENVYPREVEELLHTMPGVLDAQVVGVPDARYGEVVGAFIRRAQGAELGEADVRDYCRARAARYKCPTHVFFVDAYPVTASGKVQKYRLREMAREKLGITLGVFAGEAAAASPPAGAATPAALARREMYEIRWHGRGGQGAVTAAKILADAAFRTGFAGVSSAPSFGSERRGAPVTASTRLAAAPVRLHSQVTEPHIVVVLDDTLLSGGAPTAGLAPGGLLIVNTARPAEALGVRVAGVRVVTADVSAAAREVGLTVGGQPMVSTAILGAFAAATDLITMDSLRAAIGAAFSPAAAKKNYDAAALARQGTRA